MQKKLLLAYFILLFFDFQNNANAQQPVYDTILFETPTDKILIDSIEGNIWQIGVPQKEFFNSDHMGMKAILTDTVNSYPVNNTSSFIYVIRNPYTVNCYTIMQFWHKYDTDSLNDIGIIEASYDGGASWLTVSDTFGVPPYYTPFYWEQDYHEATGSYTAHNVQITGTSDGWIRSVFMWQWFQGVDRDTIIVNPDSLMIKFTFLSDSVFDNKEGWMIDQIFVTGADLGGCGSTKDVDFEQFATVFPNPFSSSTVVRLKETPLNATIRLYNSMGRTLIEKHNITAKELVIYRDGLPKGIYTLQVSDNGRLMASKKVIIY